MQIVSRFAPAPTGYLHLGHVVNAIFVWGLTRALGGEVLLRIEDHDAERSRAVFERALLDDLEWLGFVPDRPSFAEFRAGPCAGRQRDREAVYQAALEALARAGRVYACECSRRMLALHGGVSGERRYPGTCARKGLPCGPGRGVRVALDEGVETFEDLRHGSQSQSPAEQCGDLLVRDRDGHWTYQFAVTVDDFEQGVTVVIRGDDLLSSTGRQIQLARLLGRRSPPVFVHHPLVMKGPAQKLSKADGDTSVRDLRARGVTATDIIGRAAAAVGLTDASPLTVADLATLPVVQSLAVRAEAALAAG